MSYAAEPYAQFVDDLLTSLTGGVTREEFRFLEEDAPFRLDPPGPLVESTVRVYGQAGGAFRRFQVRTDYEVSADFAIVWNTRPDGTPATGAVLPDEGSFFYVNYEYAAGPGATPPLTDRNPGSVVRLLSESFGREYAVLSKQLEAIYRGAYVDTASGRDLDQVAALVGLTRRKATFATGTALFSRSTPAPADIFIPAGTRLSSSKPPAAVFETIAPVTLRRGSLSAETAIQALAGGNAGAVDAGVISIVNQPILGIESAANPQATGFTSDSETDEQLRARVRRAHEQAGQATVGAMLGGLTAIPGVRTKDVQVLEDPISHPGLIQINVALSEEGGENRQQIFEQAVEIIEETRPVGVRVLHNIDAPRPAGPAEPGPGVDAIYTDEPVVFGDVTPGNLFLRVDVTARLTPASRSLSEAERLELERAGDKAVQDFLAEAGIGETLVYNKLVSSLMALPGVIDVALEMFPQNAPTANRRKNLVPRSNTVRPLAGTVDVRAGGSLIVLDLNLVAIRGTAAGDIDAATLAATVSAEVLDRINNSLRTAIPAQITADTLKSLAGSSEAYSLQSLQYSVEFLDAGVRMQQQNVLVTPGAGDQIWIRKVNVVVQ